MASTDPTSPEAFLHQLVPSSTIQQAAVRFGFIRRRRKIDPVGFVVATVLSVGRRDGHSINGMRQAMALHEGTNVVRSSFWDRWTESFERLVEWLLGRLESAAREQPPQPAGLLSMFSDVVATDATVVTLRNQLSTLWPGTRSQAPAAIKVHTQVRALTGEILRHRITGERTYENQAFRPGHWRERSLYLLDRGYTDVSMWHTIEQAGAFFLIPLHGRLKPTIAATNRKHRAGRLNERPLREALPAMPRKTVDVSCRFMVRRAPHGNPLFRIHFRTVAVWNPQKRRHNVYVTNVPEEWLSPDELALAYRLRWEVETFYKTAKSGLGLNQITSTKPHIVRTMVAAALVRASITMQAKLQAERHLPKDRWINPGAWVRLWRETLVDLAHDRLTGGAKRRPSWQQLARLTEDPNRARMPTRQRVHITVPETFLLDVRRWQSRMAEAG